eukprot:CAMPEP_0182858534 /NCGR_PEP_ID=MMETSP0034_2-20130328/3732_1 /TAXON_ID=156128 /ORGANISM="Nephroselmis pyriformis, Strain CCMP717" /LENGTH=237 /DNA_ID=CAMNT_0024989975 /DNA_START=140 /DNA_END=853 /DNA_ORIENTATION=-
MQRATPFTHAPLMHGLAARGLRSPAICARHQAAAAFVLPGTARHPASRSAVLTRCKAAGAGAKKGKGSSSSSSKAPKGSSFQEAAAYLQSIGFKSNTEIALVFDIATNPKSVFAAKVGAGSNKNPKTSIEARPLFVEQDMAPVVDFFLANGIAEESLPRLIAGHPIVLAYSVEARLQPLFQFLAEIGVPDVGQAIIRRPSLLGLQVGDGGNLRRMVEYLKDTGYSDEQVVEYVCKSL